MTKHYLLMLVLIGSIAFAQTHSTSNQASGTKNKEHLKRSSSSVSFSNNDPQIEGFRLFPNPVTDGTVFIVTKQNAIKDIAIYDVLGKIVMQKQVSATYVNVSDLSSGVYILKVTESNKTVTRKLVIK